MAGSEFDRVEHAPEPTMAEAPVDDESCPIAKLMAELEAWKPPITTSVLVDVVDGAGPAMSAETDTNDTTDTTESADCAPTLPVEAPEVAPEAIAPADVVASDIPERTEDGRPIIQYVRGSLQANTRAAERCLASNGRHFQRGGAVVTVYTDPATGESAVQDLHPLGLVHALDGVSAWTRLDMRSNTWVQIDPPERICNVMVKAGQFEHLPVLNGLARQPFIRPDGSVCLSPGYDAATGLFGVFEAGEFDVPAEPTREQAQQPLAVLDDLLGEFRIRVP